MRDLQSFRLSYLQDGGDLPLLEDGHPARRLLLLPPLLPVPLVGHDRQRLVQVRLRLRQWLLPMRMLLVLLLLLLLHQEVMLLMLVVSMVLLLARRSRQRGAAGRRCRRRHEGHRLALGVGPHQPERRFGRRWQRKRER